MKRAFILSGVLVMQLLVTAAAGTLTAFVSGHDEAPPGLSAAGVTLSGLEKTEASTKIKEAIPGAVSFEGQVYPLQTSRSEAALDQWLGSQYFQETGFLPRDAHDYLAYLGFRPSQPREVLQRDEIIPQLEQLREDVGRPPQPAGITYSDGKLARHQGKTGWEVDVEGTWEKLSQTYGSEMVPLVVETTSAHPDDDDVSLVNDVLGDYTTYFNPQDKARTNNIRLAAAALNGQLISPGTEFSFNSAVGERTKSEGYQSATIFVGTLEAVDDGGGVCQVSSTLYQATRQANLPVTERHMHSKPVSYVPLKGDATVSYGTLDFRFQNDTRGYLLVSTQTGSDWVRIQIYGAADDTHPPLTHPEGYPSKSVDSK